MRLVPTMLKENYTTRHSRYRFTVTMFLIFSPHM